jgi:shikimate kinase
MTYFRRIALIGFRATGKSTIARRLSDLLEWDYFSTDKEVEEQSGLSIATMVKEYGWEYFRQQESYVIQKAVRRFQVIIDCGGGVVEDEKNMEGLSRGALMVWIDADLDDIKNRMADEKDRRPLLNQQEMQTDIELNYERRLPLYRKYSRVKVNSSRQSLEEMCKEILKNLNKKQLPDAGSF